MTDSAPTPHAPPHSPAGRPDLDVLVQARHLPGEEPRFLLRARDPAAASAVRAWAATARALGVPIAVVEQALIQADAFDAYAHKQLPGADHLPDHERRQLEYQHGRRAWRAGIPANSIDGILAAQRADDQARAEARRAARTATAETCKHPAWSFDAHGRVCPDCGTMMMDMGD